MFAQIMIDGQFNECDREYCDGVRKHYDKFPKHDREELIIKD